MGGLSWVEIIHFVGSWVFSLLECAADLSYYLQYPIKWLRAASFCFEGEFKRRDQEEYKFDSRRWVEVSRSSKHFACNM